MFSRTCWAVSRRELHFAVRPHGRALEERFPLPAVLVLQLKCVHAYTEYCALVDHDTVEGLWLAQVDLQPAWADTGIGRPAGFVVAIAAIAAP